MQDARVAQVPLGRVRQLLGRGHDRHAQLQRRLELRHDLLQGRVRAEDRDVRLRRLDRLPRVARHLHAQRLVEPGDLTEVATHLVGVDVDGADDLEALPRRHLSDDAETNRSEAEVQHPDRS